MAAKPKDGDETPKRLNRLVGAGEAINRVLDPAFRKRGFASRDIITHWAAMAPAPYDRVAVPEKLAWPRGERRAEGATLYLRCSAGHQLQLAHEAQQIAAAINRYFGYFLVGGVRLSVDPFVPMRAKDAAAEAPLDPVEAGRIEDTVGTVGDDGLRDALRRLGQGIMGKAE